MTHTYSEAGQDGEDADSRGAASWHGPASGGAFMTMSDLTRNLVCLISQKCLLKTRRPGVQIARAALCAVALIAALSGCRDNVIVDMIDRQYNIELVDRLILDESDALFKDSPKGLAFLNDTTLAVATENGSVLFVDLSDPTDLALIGRYDPVGPDNSAFSVDIVTMDGFAYVSFRGRSSSEPDDIALMVVDARQPAAPELALELPFEKVSGQLVAARDSTLYILTFDTIEVWDATDPFALALVGAYSPPQSRLLRRRGEWSNFAPPTPRQLAAEKAIGSFMAHKDPELIASQSCNSAHIGSAGVENGFLYLPVDHVLSLTTVCEDIGLWIIDVGNPAEPVPVAFLPASEFGVNVPHGFHDLMTSGEDPGIYGLATAPGYVYLTTALGTTNMAIVDVSEPASPVIFGWGSAPDTAGTFAVEDGFAYLLERNSYDNWLGGGKMSENLQVFNVADPARPVRIGIITADRETGERISGVNDVAVRGGYIFLAETQWISNEGRLNEETKVVALRLIDRDAPPLEWPFSVQGN